ncbi:hypothetical protein AB0F72_09380 [Actinoplanes sp. NPDC023936]|uniref:hypothetical protein n=1 Tax=Actinoplanes sp. NPDC023936 TaxID=3154910 RepID=UPI003407071B
MNDRLFDELLRPVVDDYYETAETVAVLVSQPAKKDGIKALTLQERMRTLQEVGDRVARVLEVAEPLWEDMRALAGLPEWVAS